MRTYVNGVSQVEASDLNLVIINQRTRFPLPIVATNWATFNAFNGWAGTPGLQSSGAGDAFVDLDVHQGYRLASLTLLCTGNAAANLTIGIDKALVGDAQNVSLGSLLTAAVPVPPADITLNMLAASTTNAGGQTVTVNAAGGTYTRSAGSFLTDGFFVGQIVAWTGFVNGGNNAIKTITALSATVMTVSNAGLVNEASAANAAQANGVSPVVDATFGLQLKLTASAIGLAVKSLRYTCAPI